MLLIAWASLGVQVGALYGPDGLLPIGPSDSALGLAVVVGAVLAVLGTARLWPRVTLPTSACIYLVFCVLGGDFLAFQWDSLLVETGVLIALLPQKARAPAIAWGFRLLLFKLYFESGVAKWQSHLGDWQDGSAMHAYYETAPLPTALAPFAHALPGWWHDLESWWALFFELVVPWLILVPHRWAGRAAFAIFTGFQILNFATANYGFFIPLSVCLHLWLLQEPPGLTDRWWRWAVVVLWGGLSLNAGLDRFTDLPASTSVNRFFAGLRLVNTYHLFGHITTERIEPEFQVLADDWTPLSLHYKPGPVDRAPPFVAPHQPRVDFRLWFYGLSYRRGTPLYVQAIAQKLCEEPQAVQSLFVEDLPAAPAAMRIAYWRYSFADDTWWQRELIEVSPTVPCRRG